jgi:hypothetical protein
MNKLATDFENVVKISEEKSKKVNELKDYVAASSN